MLFLVATAVKACAQFSGYTTYHVTATATGGGDGSLASPWTLAEANANLTAGDRALLHGGSYSDRIRPANDGASDAARIVYQAAGDGDAILTQFVWVPEHADKGAIGLGHRNYVTISGKANDGSLSDTGDQYNLKLRLENTTEYYGGFGGGSYNVVENVDMQLTDANLQNNGFLDIGWTFANYTWPGVSNLETKFNVLRNVAIHGYTDNFGTEDIVVFGGDAHHNLIENSWIGPEAKHIGINFQTGQAHTNIVRGNTIQNSAHTALSFYGLAEAAQRQDHNLVENNKLEASGDHPASPWAAGNALQFTSSESIVRYNLITEAGATDQAASSIGGIIIGIGDSAHEAVHNRFYNNTIADNKALAVGSLDFGGGGTAKGFDKYWNNVLYDNENPNGNELSVLYWRGAFDDGTDRWVGNRFGNPGESSAQDVLNIGLGNVTLAEAAALYSNPNDPEFSDWNGFSNQYDANLNTNTFTDYDLEDYNYKSSSPLLEAGAPLTQVAAGDVGTGTTLVVEDSRWFFGEAGEFPTWMDIQNDWIAIGSDPSDLSSTMTVQIAAVDDSTNTLTLADAVNRGVGDFLWLWKDSTGAQRVVGNAASIGHQESPAIGGDFDRDGDVDGFDFLVWQRGLGSAYSASDLALWKSNYGTTNLVAAATSVPEPSTIALGLVTCSLCAICRTKR
ncbi:MAG: hypothetical protein ACR2NM_05520, partial [Bythopirellula sp.]